LFNAPEAKHGWKSSPRITGGGESSRKDGDNCQRKKHGVATLRLHTRRTSLHPVKGVKKGGVSKAREVSMLGSSGEFYFKKKR